MAWLGYRCNNANENRTFFKDIFIIQNPNLRYAFRKILPNFCIIIFQIFTKFHFFCKKYFMSSYQDNYIHKLLKNYIDFIINLDKVSSEFMNTALISRFWLYPIMDTSIIPS